MDMVIDAYSHKPLRSEFIEHLLMFSLTLLDHRCQQQQGRAFWLLQHLIHHLADSLCAQINMVIRTPRCTGTGKQQAQVIIDFRNGADS